MQQFWKKILMGLGIFLLLPIGITAGMSGKDALISNQSMDLETFLPVLLCQQIDWDYEDEALKAQAVLARSSLSLCVKKGEMTGWRLQNWMEDYQKNKERTDFDKVFEKMQRAVNETRGQVLVFESQICEGIFHKVSSGYTREGTEILKDTTYAYLTGVKSSADICAENYLHGHYFSNKAFWVRIKQIYPDVNFSDESVVGQIQIVERDASDYVTRVKVGDLIVSGEEFRVKLELASANFTIQEVDGQIRFLCKGLGHGLGMSQFGANELAKKGNTYLEILKYYFPLAKIKKI